MRLTRPFLALSASLLALASHSVLAQPPRAPSPGPAATTPSVAPAAVTPRRVAALPPPPEGTDDLGFESLTTAGGLTADQAAARAVQNAPAVDRALALVAGAEANRDLARVGFYPRISANARAIYFNNVVNGSIGGGIQLPPSAITALNNVVSQDQSGNQYVSGAPLGTFINGLVNAHFPFYRSQFQLGASLTYPVSAVFLQVLPAYRAAGHTATAARLQYESDLQTVWQQAKNLYYVYVRSVAAEKIAQVSLEAAQAQLERMQALKDAGVVSNADLYRIEALVSSAEVGVVTTRTSRETATRALQLYMAAEQEELPNLSVGEDFRVLTDEATPSLETYETQALDHRTELEALRETYRTQLDRIKSARGSRYPVFSLGADTNYANPNTTYFPQTREFRATWDIYAAATWSPNDFATGSAQARIAAAERDRLEADHAQLVDSVRLEVAQSYNNYLAAREAIVSAQAELRASVETYRARFEQLQHGTVETTAVVDAFTALANARLRLVDAAVGLRVARSNLARASGEFAGPARDAARR